MARDKKDILDINDEKVFKRIFETFFPGLYYHANSVLNDISQAEEIVQEIFLVLWEKRNTYEFTENELRSYLYKAVYNNSLKYLRHKKIKQRYAEEIALKQKQVRFLLEISPEDAYSLKLAGDFENDVWHALEKLPSRCRKIFELSRFKGMKHKEIAIHLDVSINTVEKQISRALVKLREELKEYL